jgi:hypothetical protein
MAIVREKIYIILIKKEFGGRYIESMNILEGGIASCIILDIRDGCLWSTLNTESRMLLVLQLDEEQECELLAGLIKFEHSSLCSFELLQKF